MVHCTSKAQKTYLSLHCECSFTIAYFTHLYISLHYSYIFDMLCIKSFLDIFQELNFPNAFLVSNNARMCSVKGTTNNAIQYHIQFQENLLFEEKSYVVQGKSKHYQTAPVDCQKTGNCKKDIQLSVYYCVISFECLQSNSSGKIFFGLSTSVFKKSIRDQLIIVNATMIMKCINIYVCLIVFHENRF